MIPRKPSNFGSTYTTFGSFIPGSYTFASCTWIGFLRSTTGTWFQLSAIDGNYECSACLLVYVQIECYFIQCVHKEVQSFAFKTVGFTKLIHSFFVAVRVCLDNQLRSPMVLRRTRNNKSHANSFSRGNPLISPFLYDLPPLSNTSNLYPPTECDPPVFQIRAEPRG